MTPRARNKKDNGRVFLSNKPCLCLVLWGWVGFSSDTSSKLMWAQSRDAAGQHSSPSLFGRVKLFFLVLSFVQLWLTGRQTHQTSQPERMNGHRAGRGNTQQPWQVVVLRHDKRPGPHSTGSHSTHCLDNKRTHTHTQLNPLTPQGFQAPHLLCCEYNDTAITEPKNANTHVVTFELDNKTDCGLFCCCFSFSESVSSW